MSSNYVIGKNGKIPWFIKGELKRFRNITIGNNVIMGRKTFESIGNLLDERNNIILTTNTSYSVDGAIITNNLDSALDVCDKNKNVYIIGGSDIYRQSLSFANEMMLTLISSKIDGDTHFPKFNRRDWIVNFEQRNYDPINKFCYTYLNYSRQ